MGEWLRFDSPLSSDSSELAILVTAAYWRCSFAWSKHLDGAIAAGVPAAAIEAVRLGNVPDLPPEGRLVVSTVRELLEHKTLPDAQWNRTLERLGQEQTISLIALVGYYTMVCLTLNAARIESEVNPFEPVKS